MLALSCALRGGNFRRLPGLGVRAARRRVLLESYVTAPLPGYWPSPQVPQRPRGAALSLSVFSEEQKRSARKTRQKRTTPCGLRRRNALVTPWSAPYSACPRLRACWRKRRVAEARKTLADRKERPACLSFARVLFEFPRGSAKFSLLKRCPRGRNNFDPAPLDGVGEILAAQLVNGQKLLPQDD